MIKENELATKVLDTCFQLHRQYGPGLFESVYEEILCCELGIAGLHFKRQHPIPVVHRGIRLEAGFRADLIIESSIIIELKSVEAILDVHFKQVLTYLKLANLKLGLIINFNVPQLKHGIHRVANKL